ncbi:MAG: hypothetical protein WBL80_01160 [Erysipelotrichaceae bacterium]
MVQKILIAIGLLFLLTLPAQATTVKINDLVEKAKEFDGKTITLEAEAIGEVLERGDYAWININDKSSAIGVYVPIAEAKKIKFFGDYAHTGDTLVITGVMHNACVEHGGELDVHAQTITVIRLGSNTARPVSVVKIASFGLLALLAALLGLYFYKVVTPNRVQNQTGEDDTE